MIKMRMFRNTMFVIFLATAAFATKSVEMQADTFCEHTEPVGPDGGLYYYSGYGCGTCDWAFAKCFSLCQGPGMLGVADFDCGAENGPFVCGCYYNPLPN